MANEGAFAPLSVQETAAMTSEAKATKPRVTPVIPVPVDAPVCRWRHPALGDPVAVWGYHDADGQLIGYAARVEYVDDNGERKKDILPITYCNVQREGRSYFAWCCRGLPGPRPLYNLPQLITSPRAPVIVTEGEKAADAAPLLFPGYIGITSMGGACAAKKSDWTSLAGRVVVIWPDNDEPGRSYAAQVSELTIAAGAKSVAIVKIPKDWPDGWDLADALPNGVGPETLDELLKSAISPPAYISFDNYRMSDRGLYIERDDPDQPMIWLSASFEVLAQTRDVHGCAWGLLLRWRDPDNRVHEYAMPMRALGGSREEIWRELLDQGLRITPSQGGRNKLAEYLSTIHVDNRARAVSRIGWHFEGKSAAFVLPDTTYGEIDTGGARVLWQSESRVETAFKVAGIIKDWRDTVAARCIGNSRLVLATSTAFAAPLTGLVNERSGGFHFVGPSTIGKTITLRVGGSVWGGGGIEGYLCSWRATSNGLEAIAEAHCDALLCLDEMGQVEAREAGEIAYMLSNGSGKNRAARSGSAKRAAKWRLLYLSSGEISLADKMIEIGRRPKAGQEVRHVDIPADAGVGLGVFENIHGAESSGAFAEELRIATETNYGAPIRCFLQVLTAKYAADPVRLLEAIEKNGSQFLAKYLPPEASPQVRSVCNRFALAAAAGSLATAMGLTGWPDDEADRAAGICFRAWLGRRGTAGDREVEAGIRQVIAFLEAHGTSRFEIVGQPDRVINRAGFRRSTKDGVCQYMALPEAWRNEIARGYDPQALARAMIERGMLLPDGNGKSAQSVSIAGHGKLRLYVFSPSILAGIEGSPNAG
jgi:uncharacterized protein (DUF927 family)